MESLLHVKWTVVDVSLESLAQDWIERLGVTKTNCAHGNHKNHGLPHPFNR